MNGRRYLAIDPVRRVLRAVPATEARDDQLRELVGGYLELLRCSVPGCVLWADEEGKIKDSPVGNLPAMSLAARPHEIVGTVVLDALDERGESIGLQAATIDRVASRLLEAFAPLGWTFAAD